MLKKRIGNSMIVGGLLLIAAALSIIGYNMFQEQKAEENVTKVLGVLEEKQEAAWEEYAPTPSTDASGQPVDDIIGEVVPDYMLDPDMEMPEVITEGQAYVGVLEIPVLDLSLPVLSEWDAALLKLAPCRFVGTAYRNDLIIMAHNYEPLFGALSQMGVGDQAVFTDMLGNRFTYRVLELEIIGPNDIDELLAGEWDMTLFTCTPSGAERVVVRCERMDP